MHRPTTLAVCVAAAALLLTGCGGDEKVTDINSATAQECKSGLAALFEKAQTEGAEIDEDEAPDSCKDVADETGQEILRQITAETAEKFTAELDAELPDIPGLDPAAADALLEDATSADPDADVPDLDAE